MTTYSLAQTASIHQNFRFQPANHTLPDAMVTGGATVTTATAGGIAYAMSQNTPLLCKAPDGSLQYFTLDAERSLPGSPVLKRV